MDLSQFRSITGVSIFLTLAGITLSASSASASTPTQLKIITAPVTVKASQCSTVITTERWDAWTPQAESFATLVSLSGTGLTFYSDAACTTAITSVTIPIWYSTASFYVKSTTAGTKSFTVSSTGLTSASQNVTVTSTSTSTQLKFLTAKQTVTANSCSKVYTVERWDAWAPQAENFNTVLSFAGSNIRFYSDAACSKQVTTLTIGAWYSKMDFYIKSSVTGTRNITVSAAGLTSAVQSVTISSAPAPSQSPSPTPTVTPSPSPSPSPSVAPSPSVTPSPSPTAPPAPSPSPSPTTTPAGTSKLSAVWANDGGDKVHQSELRASTNANAVFNSLWTGSKIKLFGAKNEVLGFNLVLEAATQAASGVSVVFNQLTGPGGSTISSTPTSGNGVFNWVGRNIELFFVRYLQIKGLSRISYENYDERHVPKRFQRPYTGAGIGSGTWSQRPDADKFYPEIAVPLELQSTFSVAAGQNQSIFSDIYIPKTATSGLYTGTVSIFENGALTRTIPVELTVRNFTLPETPSNKTMLFMGYSDIGQRYTGTAWPNAGSAQDLAVQQIRDRHFQMAHRHKISIIDSDPGASAWSADQPRPEWLSRLNGSLFTSAKGYDGPGTGVGNNVYAIGAYGQWSWKNGTETDMRTHTDAWKNWFNQNSPSTDAFLYLIDESTNYTQIEQWASWIKNNPGPGALLKAFATMNLPEAFVNTPTLNSTASWMAVGDTTKWENALAGQKAAGKQVNMYNGRRPATGSFATEDDGVALRQLAWAQYKKKIDRWFFWESTYYNDYQSGRGQNDLFNKAVTFGTATTQDPSIGETGWNHSNGDGVMFYPGTDTVFPTSSYGVAGPIASLRLKHWRRGIQDADYLTLARAINPTAVDAIVNQTVPKVLWENGVADPLDPSWQRCDIGWSINPDNWEAVRAQLANIIETGSP